MNRPSAMPTGGSYKKECAAAHSFFCSYSSAKYLMVLTIWLV